jgi:hypothetical protein
MLISLILVLVGFAFVLFLVRAARGHATALVTRVEELQGRTVPLDLAAFRNLIDPAEENYLRLDLSAREFKAIQRERIQAAIEYVRCAKYNAAILLRLGEAAQRNPSPGIAAAGRQLVGSAIRLRLYALMALFKLYAALLFPNAHISPQEFIEDYQRLSNSLAHFTRLHRPGLVTRVSSTI